MNIASHPIEALLCQYTCHCSNYAATSVSFYIEPDITDKVQTQIGGNRDFFQSQKYLNIHHPLRSCVNSPISDFRLLYCKMSVVFMCFECIEIQEKAKPNHESRKCRHQIANLHTLRWLRNKKIHHPFSFELQKYDGP